MTNGAILSRKESAENRKTRALILTAAERHFKHFGYGKTTISEIAKDCAMSHANVYRFFRNKADLADAVAERWLGKIIDVGLKVSNQPGTAKERLVDLVFELHRMKKRELLRTSRVHEILTLAARDGRPCIEAHEEKIAGLFAAIVAYGNDTKEFACADPASAGVALHAATLKFCHPLLVEQYRDQDLEAQIRVVTGLIIEGLSDGSRRGA